MIDITKDEFWNSKYEEEKEKINKKSRLKLTLKNHKFIIITLMFLGICMTVNVILIYKFFNILKDL